MLRMLRLAFILALTLNPTTPNFTPEQLWALWPQARFVSTPAPCLRPAELEADLGMLVDLYPGDIRVEEIGQSVGGRPIELLTLGHGTENIFLWSQMHGDEPSATPALLDIASFLLAHEDQPAIAAILQKFTLLMVPMLNPDGAEAYERRNLQGIDINRDALNLATPEGRLLKRLRDEYLPILGFNLHDQDRRATVGDTGVLASVALLAVAGDAGGTMSPGRLRAMRACSAIAQAMAPFIPGGTARYDEDWNPRAFGDNITAWGTPVVLIENGGVPPGGGFAELTRLDFVAILTVLQGLAADDLATYGPEVYENLPRTRRNGWSDVVVRGGFVQQPGFDKPFRADVAYNVYTSDRSAAGCGSGSVSRIVEIGDARFVGAGREVDGRGSLIVAPFVAGVEGWKARRWLSAKTLEDLARLGVGTVVWQVSRRKLEAAETLTREVAGEGRARVKAVAKPEKLPWLRLTGPPARPASDALPDTVTALRSGRKGSLDWGSNLLERLTEASQAPNGPTLRVGGPASFVVLVPAVEGRIDPVESRLSLVFTDGVEEDSRGGAE